MNLQKHLKGKRIATDEQAMRYALLIARLGVGSTWPNPLVGAVVVKDGVIVGAGAHLKAGGAHAEVMALKDANELAVGSTLYVTLEPCNHQGKTPPCTSRIIEAKVRKVVFAIADSNPSVAGGGSEKLKQAGIEVQVGLLNDLAREQNLSWFHAIEKQRLHLTLKIAISRNAKITNALATDKWITSSVSRAHVQRLRATTQAIMVGVNTLLADNPKLNNRSARGTQPLRVILDSNLRTPDGANVLIEAKSCLFFCDKKVSADLVKQKEALGAEVICVESSSEGLNLEHIVEILFKRGIYSLICEGGAKLARSLLAAGLVDRLLLYESDKDIENGLSFFDTQSLEEINARSKLNLVNTSRISRDMLYDYRREGS